MLNKQMDYRSVGPKQFNHIAYIIANICRDENLNLNKDLKLNIISLWRLKNGQMVRR